MRRRAAGEPQLPADLAAALDQHDRVAVRRRLDGRGHARRPGADDGDAQRAVRRPRAAAACARARCAG